MSKSSAIELFDYPASPNCRDVRIILAEKNLGFRRVHVDLLKGEQKMPKFLDLNPKGQVPVLRHEGVIVCDSTRIGLFLEEKYPEPPLWPRADREREEGARLLALCDERLKIALGALIFERILKPSKGARDPLAIAEAERQVHALLPVLEEKLAARRFVLGDQYTLVDSKFTAWAAVLPMVGIAMPVSVRRWYARMQARPSFNISA